MAELEFLSDFRLREGEDDVLKAQWYIVAASALTAACAGEQVAKLYQLVTQDLPVETRKLVQRRIKEALLKGSILYGVPRAAQGLGPLYRSLPEDEIDLFSPRTEKLKSKEYEQERAEKARRYFDVLWGPAAAEQQRARVLKFHPDHYLLNVKTNYELWISEDAILSNVETQMCTTALLICNNSPEQALWHVRGLLRHGATVKQARFAQDVGLAVASHFGAKTGDITMAEDVEFPSHSLAPNVQNPGNSWLLQETNPGRLARLGWPWRGLGAGHRDNGPRGQVPAPTKASACPPAAVIPRPSRFSTTRTILRILRILRILWAGYASGPSPHDPNPYIICQAASLPHLFHAMAATFDQSPEVYSSSDLPEVYHQSRPQPEHHQPWSPQHTVASTYSSNTQPKPEDAQYYDHNSSVVGHNGTPYPPAPSEKKSKKIVCGCSLVVLVLSLIIAALSAAVIGLAAGTGISTKNYNDANAKLDALRISYSSLQDAATTAAADSSTAGSQTATSSAASSSETGDVTRTESDITNGCSDAKDKTTGTTYDSNFYANTTYTMYCSKNAPNDPLFSLFTADFSGCMEACTAWNGYSSTNGTCKGVSFIPGWSSVPSAATANTPGDCYLKPGPQSRTKLDDAVDCHAAIAD
ncbi:hypothetical protein AK830_g6728 [Neonectria ditissima]|uniref:Carboxymuconolactone decarboxylase-like domain-containing protein n=1 Tax=Neonectria ditissima TaxID=78410 RepID=A0A0P7AZ92_9HYPO|nr:hypothetical protein AK830_g6728 [Neonectria ditissima]